MKRIIPVFFSLLFLLSTTAIVSHAEDTPVLNNTKILSVNEQYDMSQNVTVTIAPVNSSIIDSDNLPVFMYLYNTDDNGLLNVDITLSPDWKSGRYNAYIDSPSELRTIEFIYVNSKDVNTLNVLLAINECETGEEIAEILSEVDDLGDNGAKIGVDIKSEEYIMYSKDALEYCAYSKTVDYSVESFSDAFKKGISISSLLNDIVNAEAYGDIQNIIESNSDILGITFDGDYEDVKSKHKVYIEIFKNREDVDGISDLADLFDDAVQTVLDSEYEPPKKPTTNRGGGGGGSKVSLPATVPETLPDTNVTPENTPENSQPQQTQLYSDIKNHFSENAVSMLSDKGIITGYPDGSFKPDAPVTRAEFAKMASIAFGIETADTDSFSDVSDNDWYASYVGGLANNGALNGYNGFFNPDNLITRQDAVCVIYRLLSGIIPVNNENDFEDNDDISDYAVTAVSSLYHAGIVNGNNNSFNPLSGITRGEAAVLIANTFKIEK